MGTAPHDIDSYAARVRSAAELYHSGRVRGLLLSGDHSRIGYDEPGQMREDLIAAGVSEQHLTLDYAGFRTRDSVIRARDVFNVASMTIVSQRFHSERALYIARAEGIEAVAFVADDPPWTTFRIKVRVRELLARSSAVLETWLGTPPRHLGEPVALRLRGPPR